MKRSIKSLTLGSPLFFCLWLLAAPPLSAEPVSAKILDQIEFQETSLETALDYLRQRSQQLDPTGQGFNFILEDNVDREAPVTLTLKKVPLGVALAYTIEMAGASYKVDRFAVRITGDVLARDNAQASAFAPMVRKAQGLWVDDLEIDGASLEAAVQFLATKSETLDKRGVGINLLIHPMVDRSTPLSMKLTDVPFSAALHYVAELTGTKLRVDRHAIVFEPKYSDATKLAQLSFPY